MTPSTTNTAARELLASALDECGRPTDAAEVREGRNPFVRGEYALAAIEKALTQQQGGEQEARELLAAEYELDGADYVAQCIRRDSMLTTMEARCLRAISAALRTKQPAASEGDVAKFVRDLAENGLRYGLDPCHDWTSKETIFAFWRGYMGQADRSIRDRAAAALQADNTSKQAAGEAVLAHEPMVPRKDMKRLYNAYVRLLESGRDRIRDLGGECDGVDVMERNDLDLRHARDVLTTPPRHPADGGMAMQWPRGVLNRDKTLELLISHNEWRRGKEGPQTDPRLLGLALEATIAAIQAGSP